MDDNKPSLARIISFPDEPEARRKDVVDSLRQVANEIENGDRNIDNCYLYFGGIILYYKALVEQTGEYEIVLINSGGAINILEFDGLLRAVSNSTIG